MERLVSANDHKVKVTKTLHIPNDVSFFILSKLPIKSLKRFECVCKSWSLLFHDSYFMTMYRNYFLTKDHSYYDGISVLLHKKKFPPESHWYEDTFELYYGVSGERFDNRVKLDWPSVKLDWPSVMTLDNPDYEHDSGFDILGSGSVHGTLCLSCVLPHNIIFWNPSSKEFKVIPPSPFDYEPYWTASFHHGSFGYDQVRDDYKLMLRLGLIPKVDCHLDVQLGKDISEILEIYSLRSNSWRKLNCNMPFNISMDTEQLYIDGLSHWMCNSRSHNEGYLMSFDWSNETFITTPIPTYMNEDIDHRSVWSHLVLLNASISLIVSYRKTTTFHISILGELGVKESWTKIFTVGPLPCLDYPIGAGNKGDMLFQKIDGGLFWFNLNTQMIVDLGIISQLFCCKIVIYKENLLPLLGKNT